MKKFAKILCLMLAVIFCVSCFAACGEQKSIVVGYTIYEPMNYKDADGELIGFDTDLAKAVFEGMGYKVTFKEIEWKNKYADLNSGAIDCIWNGFTCNSADDDGIQRNEKVDFSYNYMENAQAVIVKKTTIVNTADDLKGKIGTAESSSAGEKYAKGFSDVIKGVTKQTDGLLAVNAGTADFTVVDIQLARSYCGKGDYADLTIVDSLGSDVEFYAIGFKKGSDLTSKVNAELEKLAANGTLKNLGEKYGVANSVITDFTSQKSVEK